MGQKRRPGRTNRLRHGQPATASDGPRRGERAAFAFGTEAVIFEGGNDRIGVAVIELALAHVGEVLHRYGSVRRGVRGGAAGGGAWLRG